MAAFRKYLLFRGSGLLQTLTREPRDIAKICVSRTITLSPYSLYATNSDRAYTKRQDIPLSPAVRFLIDAHPSLNPADIVATGPKGRLLKGDILNYLEGLQSGMTSEPVSQTSQLTNSYEDFPLSNMRKTIAKRLTASKREIPYSYVIMECEVDQVVELKKEIYSEKGIKVSVNDIIVKAVASTLETLPQSNAIWNDKDSTIQYLPNIDVGVAVAIEGGLITPIIRNANTLSILEISSQIKMLAERARAGKLQPHEYQGGSFCISNLGMYGIKEFTAIINPPQSAILAVGGIQLKPHPGNSEEKGGVTRTITVTLSCDTRVIDYELASKWLSFYKQMLESPLILGI